MNSPEIAFIVFACDFGSAMLFALVLGLLVSQPLADGLADYGATV